MSAILDDNEKHPVIQVLYALYPGFGGLEFSGVIEVLSKALHQKTDSSMAPSLHCSIANAESLKAAKRLKAPLSHPPKGSLHPPAGRFGRTSITKMPKRTSTITMLL